MGANKRKWWLGNKSSLAVPRIKIVRRAKCRPESQNSIFLSFIIKTKQKNTSNAWPTMHDKNLAFERHGRMLGQMWNAQVMGQVPRQ
jgi:hypothetical protein